MFYYKLIMSAPPYEAIDMDKVYYKPLDRLKQISAQYEINHDHITNLYQLQNFEIVCIIDDSGSMNNPIVANTVNFSEPSTRWDELKSKIGIVVDIASCFDPDGIDVYFLNKQPLKNINKSEQLFNSAQFNTPPAGGTPLAKCLNTVLFDKKDVVKERNLLIIIATDGEPTDMRGSIDIKGFKDVMNSRDPIDKIFVTFMVCTEDDDAIEYLNKWDNKMKNIDVVDDYHTEKKQILKSQGKHFPFSMGDYIAKLMLGSVNSYYDNLDSKKICNLL